MFTIGEVARIAAGEVLGDAALRPTGCAADSRRVAPGDLFFALPGARVDGHAFLDDAFARGACAAVVADRARAPRGRTCVVVREGLTALHAVAAAWRERFAVPFVGITGSNGKTTTKELLAHLAAETFAAHAAQENYNTEIGLPLAILAMPEGTELGVFELAADRPGDIALLVRLLRPSIALVTSIGQSHLETFGTQAAVAEEKWDLVRGLASDGRAWVNADCPELRDLASAEPRGRLTTVGLAHGDARGRLVAAVPRLVLDVVAPPLHLATTLVGEHNATNLLLAALCAADLGVPPAAIERRAASFQPVAHRLNVRPTGFGWLLDDVYNANPTSMAAALRALVAFGGPRSRRVVVFGDMLGLGAQTAVLHDEIARLALGLAIERVYPVGDASCAAFARTGDPRVRCLARDEIGAELAGALAGARDAVVLVKGSRGMRLEQLADEIEARSPRCV